MAGRWARYALFATLGAAMEHAPERLDFAIGRGVAIAAGRFASGARRGLRENIAHALAPPGGTVPPALLDRFVDRAFECYGQYWAEGAKLPAIPDSVRASRFVIAEGMEILEEAKAAGRGIIMALPHVGSWEWGGAFLAHIGLPMTAVAEVLEPPQLFEWFKAKREAIGLTILPLDDKATTALLSTLRAGGTVGLLCDRDLQGNGVPVELFGETVTVPAGPAALALRTGAALVVAACYTGPGDGHHAVVRPIDTTRQGLLREDVARCTQAVTTELEWLIRRAPEQWHVLQPRFSP